MRKLLVRIGFCALLSGGLSQPAAAEAPPLEAYGELPSVENMALSPSGESIAILTTMQGQRMLLALGSDMSLRRRLDAGALKLRDFYWVGDEALLAITSRTEDLGYGFTADEIEVARALIVPMAGSGEAKLVFGEQRDLMGAIFGEHGIRKVGNEWHGYFGAIKLERGTDRQLHFEHGRPYLYDASLVTGRARRLADPALAGHYRDWLLDQNGEVAAQINLVVRSGEWQIRNGDLKLLASGVELEGDVGFIALGTNGDTVVYYEEGSDGNTDWYEVALSGESEPKVFLDKVDIDRLYVDALSGRITGYLTKNAPVFFDPEHQSVANKVRAAFAGRHFELMDWTPDMSHLLVRTRGNEDSGTWFKVDVANLSAEAIGFERPAIGVEHVGPISLVEYTAADGLEMDGVLTLPPDREAKNLPVIMFPHGGPHAHDEVDFDWWAQAFASRGYAVFQPNFRGSTNRSDEFRRAGYGEWGGKMQSDISDGLSKLVELGIADPKRACIMGGSYGGYAALAGVTLQQGLYRCAVAFAPVSDLSGHYRNVVRETGRSRMVRRNLQEQYGEVSNYREVSPRYHADKADAPILLIHGRDDTVVEFAQSKWMADALKDAGKPFDFVELEGEDHHLSLSETRLKMLQEAMAFVQKHNPAD